MNGLNVSVSQDEFKSKDAAERDWLLFEAINSINVNGCTWMRRSRWIRKAYAIAAGAGIIGGGVAIIARLVCQ